MKRCFVWVVVFFTIFTEASEVEHRSDHCQSEKQEDLKIKMEDMGWGQNPTVMASKFEAIYSSGKRLEARAYKTQDGFVLPTNSGGEIKMGARFINSVKSHIEVALKNSYADYIFFSDMGHSHLLVDRHFYDNVVRQVPSSDKVKSYELMLNHKMTKFLYHTAEQLEMKLDDKLIDDRKIKWRFFTRNLVGDNLKTPYLHIIHAKDHPFNTAHIVNIDKNEKNYKYWGAGFSISASNEGCFAFSDKGVKKYFDISLYDVKYGNLSSGGD